MFSKFKSNIKVFLVFLILAVSFYLYVIFDGYAILNSLVRFALEPGEHAYLSNVYQAYKERGIHRFIGSGDAMSQYVHFAEYFRTLFYDTWNLFPQYAPHLSGGQNIFNFSYYGLYNPIYMFSFLLPTVSMITYIEVSSVLALAVSGYLMFKVLQMHGFRKSLCYIVGICFMSSASITAQTYTNFMFVNFIPFLLLAMIGTKQHIEKNKSLLLIFSVTTIILMSYYFALPCLITLSIYALFCYFDWHKEIEVKTIIKDGLLYIATLAISVFMSAILLLPTIHQILASRVESVSLIDMKVLFDFRVDLALLMYSPYAMGFGMIAAIGIIYNLLFEKKSAYKIVSLAILLFISFPFFSYFMNGGTSLHSKVFIPFGVLVTLLISNLLNDVIDNHGHKSKASLGVVISIVLLTLLIKLTDINLVLNNIKIIDLCVTAIILISALWIGNKKWAERFAYLIIAVTLVGGLLAQNSFRTYNSVLYDYYFGDDIKNEIDAVLEDEEGLYRFTYLLGSKYHSCNKIFTDRFYRTSLHSSLYNKAFLEFRNHVIDVEQSSGGHSNDYDTEDLMYNMYMGNKYMINDFDDTLGYEQVSQYVYVNKDVLPLGYVKSKTMAVKDFEQLSVFEKKEAILKYAVIKNGNANEGEFLMEALQLKDFKLTAMDEKIIYNQVENGYDINSMGETQIIFEPNTDMTGQVLLISFHIENDTQAKIGINGIYNRIMSQSYIYYIDNKSFSYVIGKDQLHKIVLDLSEGYYELRNIKIAAIAYNDLKKYVHDIEGFEIDLEKTRGNKILGNIKTDGGYFVLNVPFDKGFQIEVDDQSMPYEVVNGTFIGFPIEKGSHSIKIVYKAPWFNVGAIISAITLLVIIMVCVCRNWVTLTMLPSRIKIISKKNQKIIRYLIVGVSTTVISITTYYALIFFKIDYKMATIISWLVTVLYAYFMNKTFVFRHDHVGGKDLLQNILMFYSGRLITLVLDIVLMMVLVELMSAGEYISKIYVNVLILVINYFISECIIFRKKGLDDEKNANSIGANL